MRPRSTRCSSTRTPPQPCRIDRGRGSGRYPALSPRAAGAALYERMIHDLFGHVPDGAAICGPGWTMASGPAPTRWPPAACPPSPPPSLPDFSEQDRHMVLPSGPLPELIGEAAHLRLTLDGPVDPAGRKPARLHPQGHAGADAGQIAAQRRPVRRPPVGRTRPSPIPSPSPRRRKPRWTTPRRRGPQRLRVIMLETERIAGHLDTLAEIGRLAGSGRYRQPAARCGKSVLRACQPASVTG